MPPAFNPLSRLMRWRSGTRSTDKLYGAIVAQARLPVFYRSLGIPDSLQGRFALLSLHLFAVLHRLKGEGAEALAPAQALMERFSKDMDTVLREIGVSDLRIPKTVRGLAASSHALLESYETAFASGDASFAAAIAAALPLPSESARLSSELLASYLRASVRRLEQQPLASLQAGTLDVAEVTAMDKARKTNGLSGEIDRPPLSRIVRIDDVKDGEERLVEVDQTERETIAALLDLASLDRLSFACGLYRRGEGRLFLQGTLAASVTQTCVVSLEPVASALQVPVEIEFWPTSLIDQLTASSDEAASHGMLDWPEPIVDRRIDLGPVIYETLATALDPYPRREGASFEWSNAGEAPGAAKAESPFAALEQLKRR
jgi:cytochrome b pre-mRNA-processing protein 3